jgi:hypothetical protein
MKSLSAQMMFNIPLAAKSRKTPATGGLSLMKHSMQGRKIGGKLDGLILFISEDVTTIGKTNSALVYNEAGKRLSHVFLGGVTMREITLHPFFMTLGSRMY